MYTVDEDMNVVNGSGRRRKPTEHQRAVAYAHKTYGGSLLNAKRRVRSAKKQAEIHGGSFWSWLADKAADVGKAVVGSIPIVGDFAKEGIDALQHHRKYNFANAVSDEAIDTAASFIPGGALVRGAVKMAAHHIVNASKGNAHPVDAVAHAHEIVKALSPHAVALNQAIKNQAAKPGGVHLGANAPVGGGRRKSKAQSSKMKRRGCLIRKIMRETGCSLCEASHMIKRDGLM